MRLLVTGAAGFIGFHVAKERLQQGDVVIGIDNLNDYYDVGLKQARLSQLRLFPNFIFYQADICDLSVIDKVFANHKPQRVVHLAAQAGVRYSLENAHIYVQSNLVGFTNIIESCRHYQIEHLVYASTSSVYGANSSQPYREEDSTNHPLTIYAATKKANELIAHSYSHLYQLPTTGLRFFTVYGPWGRPDMAFFSFTRDILNDNPIKVYNFGSMQRDFTYIDDIVIGISRVVDKPAATNNEWQSQFPHAASSLAPYRIYNLGGGHPVNLINYIHAIEQATGKQAIKELLPMQKGDVLSTCADTDNFEHDFAYKPSVTVQEGIQRFVEWYKAYYC
ncbi:MAG: NAD-dependent epimerase [Legionella sp.]